ncbi:MAG: 3-oxoacyl-ACP synthase III family protein [Kofleriaceae bacterium]
MPTNVGILGLGMYLPAEVRRNDWWPAELVARWMEQRKTAPRPVIQATSEGTQRVLAAMAEQAVDPFQGAVERRVMSPGMTVFDMEEHAARQAIERSGVPTSRIDFVLSHTIVPDHQVGNTACEIHHRLGLPRACFAMQTEAAAYSFLLQITLAQSMIVSGQASHALIVQSCAASLLLDATDPISPLFGDGATAVVLGPVSAGRGVLGSVHYANGQSPRTLVAGVRGRRWFDDGRVTFHVADQQQMHATFLETADVCKSSVDAVREKTALAAKDVDWLFTYQGTPWLRRVVQDYAGLQHAKSIETFALTGYLCSAIIPSGLALAEQQNLLADDQVLVMTGGGTGMTCGAIAMRWGR